MPHRKNPSLINVANSHLQEALNNIFEISNIILDCGVFGANGDARNKEYMQLLQKQAQKYQEELAKHNNMINIELFNHINAFLKEQAEMFQENGAFFEDLFNNPHTKPMAERLFPVLGALIFHAERAIDRYSDLKQATSSHTFGDSSHSKKHKHDGLSSDDNNSDILGSMMGANIENVLTNLLKHLPEIMDAYQTFMNVVNSVVSGVVQSESHHHNTSEHETAARPSGILHEHEKHASHAKKHQKYPQEGHKTSKHKSHKRGERPE